MANGYLIIGGPLAGQYHAAQESHFTVNCAPCTIADALSGKTTMENVTYVLTVIAKLEKTADESELLYAWLPVGMTPATAIEALIEGYCRYGDLT